MLAMGVNDNAGCLMPRVVRASIASMLAPTGGRVRQIALWVFNQPRPASVVVSGLYSQPTQPW